MRVLFIGSGEIALPSLRWLLDSPGHDLVGLVTQPDKPAGRDKTLRPPATKTLALARGIPVLQPEKIKAPEALAAIAALRPETAVVMAYGQILPPALLALPPVACINLHASLLPRHRGASPIHAAIAAGDRVTGITVMHVAEGLDTGDAILSRQIPVRRRETAGSLHDRLALLAPLALADALAAIASGDAPRAPQDDALATYSPKLDRASAEIDWGLPARQLERLVRAMCPWPSAWTRLPARDTARETKILSAIFCRKPSGPPGQILAADRRGILVAAGEGALLLKRIQPANARPMDASEFLLGNPIPPGSRAG